MKSKVSYTYNATVARLIDGDSGYLDIDAGFNVWIKKQPFRLCGPDGRAVNAPEWDAPGGAEATAWARAALPVGAPVTIQTFKARKSDKYARWLACVWLTELVGEQPDIATAMVAAGHAAWGDAP